MLDEIEWDSENLHNRWAIYIDIEGFSKRWNSHPGSMSGLHDLMDAIFKIGTSKCFHDEGRLFAHHVGDAFLIASDFGEVTFERPFAVATVLMKYLVPRGFFAKAAISSGALADYVGCYPRAVQDAIADGHSCAMGDGVMTVMSVLGPGLINVNDIAKRSPSGPILTIDSNHKSKLERGVRFRATDCGLLLLNWVEFRSNLVEMYSSSAGLNLPDSETLKSLTEQYVAKHELSLCWKQNALAHFESTCWEVI